MSDDLISQEKIAKEISEIMADVFFSHFRREIDLYDELNHKIQECIKNQPVAYDLESVIEQLEECVRESSNIDYNRAMIESIKILKSTINTTKGDQEHEQSKTNVI